MQELEEEQQSECSLCEGPSLLPHSKRPVQKGEQECWREGTLLLSNKGRRGLEKEQEGREKSWWEGLSLPPHRRAPRP